jgi:hypothetical protein
MPSAIWMWTAAASSTTPAHLRPPDSRSRTASGLGTDLTHGITPSSPLALTHASANTVSHVLTHVSMVGAASALRGTNESGRSHNQQFNPALGNRHGE